MRLIFSAKTDSGSEIISRHQSWYPQRAERIAASIILLGFLARLCAGWGTFLNPDEALHFRLANQASLWLAYKQSLTASHPPLLTVLLYYFRFLGTSELWLRMPSILGGTVFCWTFYKWLSRENNQLAGMIGLLFGSFLFPIITLSAEIRQYALLLGFLGCALYLLDRATETHSAGLMAASFGSLYLGLSSHYSGFFFAAVLGIYGLLRILTMKPSNTIISGWVAGQTGVLALAVIYYKTHISTLGAGDSRPVLQGWMSEFYLNRSYFEPGRDNPFLFVIGHTFGVFQFIFGQLAAGDIAGLLFISGLLLLWRSRGSHEPINKSWYALWIFLLLLFIQACALSLLHLYPYGGTRQIAYLIIPTIAGVSIAIAAIARQRWVPSLIMTGAVLFLSLAFPKIHAPHMDRSDQRTRNMVSAIRFTDQHFMPSDLIFVDYQSDLIVGHYLCNQEQIVLETAPEGFEQFHCGGHQVVSADYKNAWMFSGENFLPQWERFIQAYRLKPGQEVWIFQTGWKIALPEELRREFAQLRNLPYESFGNNIKLLKLAVGPDSMPVPVNALTAVSGLQAHSNPVPVLHSHPQPRAHPSL
ncbi:MAG TPA: glycosyltransferase family 39 protein [Candidatus Sulfotelmatobacter sp.]